MPGFSMKDLKEAGRRFLQHLEDTDSMNITSKAELRTIYAAFKKTQCDKLPNFSSVLYSLKTSGKAMVLDNTINLGQVVRKTSLIDQYVTVRKEQELLSVQPPPQNGQKYTRAQAQKIIQWMKQSRQDFIANKNGIQISSQYDLTNGRIRFPLPLNELKVVHISIKNTSNKSVTFVQYKLLRRMRTFSFQDEDNVSATNSKLLAPGAVYDLIIQASTAYYGYFPVTLVFEFMAENSKNNFFIGKFISAVSTSSLANDLAPTARYVPYQKNLRKVVERIEEDGIPPDGAGNYNLEREVPLGEFIPASQLKYSLRNGQFSSNVQKERHLMSTALDFNNYNEKFHLLLYLEEIQMEIDIRKYDRIAMNMNVDERDKRLLVLDVPGVAENRPSVLKGDHLFVTFSHESNTQGQISYKGYVHGVELEKVTLGFSSRLRQKFIPGMLFDVSFTFNRLPLRILHRAVDIAKEKQLRDILFPTFSNNKCIVNTDRLSLYDRNLENNPEQYMAVKQIVSGISRPAPYLIFGPPGTGKTVTLVEALKQVLKNIPKSCVLACAPSNSASDLLCQRLMKHVNKREILRIMASSRDFRSVSEDIKPCCNWNNSTQQYDYPSKKKLMEYRVIITTLITAGRLVSANFPPGHFSHVFIDESGHAVEPESVTAIAGILDVINPNGGQLVLAGDPKQLGPILRSPFAIDNGLGMSLLERLMTQNPLYGKSNGSYNSQFVSKLLLNYRSHPDILTIPNELFYDNELQSKAEQMVAQVYCSWEMLPKKGFPIIFHGVLGKDEREGNSPSFFNTIEIEVLMNYLEAILKTQGKKGIAKISPKEIGIISPYRKQVEKIRKAITIRGVADSKDLKIGSVEEFQGQERKVILISTVRSSKDYVKFDEDFSLGFLKNPKRFNVAITRAKSLLILVGNPVILQNDPNWSRFLKFCCDNGGYNGYALDELEDLNDDEFAASFRNLSVNDPPAGEESGESAVQQQGEPAWRHEH